MQNRRAFVFFALAVVFGIGAALAAQHLLEQRAQTPGQRKIETSRVVTARSDVGTAVALTPQHLDAVKWPSEYLPQGTFSKAKDLDGRVLRRPLAKGEPVLESSLLPTGSEAGLVSVIADTKRAVSVKVDPIVGVAGFVRPGSRVDVLATLRRVDRRTSQPESKVVLQNVKVLAIDQKMEEASNGDPELVSVVTLEVDPKDSEKLAYTAHEGRLQLALRSPSDHEIVETRGVTVASLLDRKKIRSGKVVPRDRVEVLMGSSVSKKSF